MINEQLPSCRRLLITSKTINKNYWRTSTNWTVSDLIQSSGIKININQSDFMGGQIKSIFDEIWFFTLSKIHFLKNYEELSGQRHEVRKRQTSWSFNGKKVSFVSGLGFCVDLGEQMSRWQYVVEKCKVGICWWQKSIGIIKSLLHFLSTSNYKLHLLDPLSECLKS